MPRNKTSVSATLDNDLVVEIAAKAVESKRSFSYVLNEIVKEVLVR